MRTSQPPSIIVQLCSSLQLCGGLNSLKVHCCDAKTHIFNGSRSVSLPLMCDSYLHPLWAVVSNNADNTKSLTTKQQPKAAEWKLIRQKNRFGGDQKQHRITRTVVPKVCVCGGVGDGQCHCMGNSVWLNKKESLYTSSILDRFLTRLPHKYKEKCHFCSTDL